MIFEVRGLQVSIHFGEDEEMMTWRRKKDVAGRWQLADLCDWRGAL